MFPRSNYKCDYFFHADVSLIICIFFHALQFFCIFLICCYCLFIYRRYYIFCNLYHLPCENVFFFSLFKSVVFNSFLCTFLLLARCFFLYLWLCFRVQCTAVKRKKIYITISTANGRIKISLASIH